MLENFLKERGRELDGLNMTQAIKLLRKNGIKGKIRDKLIQIIPDDGYETKDGNIFINTPEDWLNLGLEGTPQYFFQVM
ncbi:hypothetical protein [Nostoc phage N1]|nr:hypothetical protein [Nostoc phage N1]